jgi:alpha-1,3-rhamnosyltransferase
MNVGSVSDAAASNQGEHPGNPCAAASESLLTVVVVTYNSARFVRDTLESIRQQTLRSIELIVTDDHSSDATVQICEEWLRTHAARFVATRVVTSATNTGIAPNCNRGLRHARGTWVKLLAGDDLLAPGFAQAVVACGREKPAARVLVCDVESFMDGTNEILSRWPGSKFVADPRSHFKRQLIGGYINAAGIILHRQVLADTGGFDERFPFLEDDPMWIRLLGAGVHFHRCPAAVVRKRDHPESVSISSRDRFVHPAFFDSSKRFKEMIALPLMRKKHMFCASLLTRLDLGISERILRCGNHGRTRSNRLSMHALNGLRTCRRWLGRYYRLEYLVLWKAAAHSGSGPGQESRPDPA